ncbi:uncharacterized protein H6S33_005953 [Morchella sextelata]|uniref:uncharacterized protein n=1 Tax=Morchella sextelata TaxID=1174677 RepID=UPI001D044CEC|nr:uncharacterized protein H6S33_005953 [Morchella sextelata]KAH0614067.1 hypothetical protein H6S33_005953 [Morchella sextelata]
MEEKYIGLLLAITSSMAIGTSFILTKKGLIDTADRTGFEGEGFTYLKNPIWWVGMVTMILGEIANFAAYAFAPAILVTPLGALSVLVGAVLGTYFLKEELGVLGKLGCAICLIGSVIIVLHAPPDKEITTIDEILNYAIQPGFLLYCVLVIIFSSVMIYVVSPKYGKKNPLIYISICGTVGSLTVMSSKAFGIAVKLTFAGDKSENQFTHPSTYVFVIVVGVCILTQMNYFNKALTQFSSSLVTPLYYVTFTTATLIASFILFQGFNTTDPVNTISLLCGFLIIFSGVYLLNISRTDPNGKRILANGRASTSYDEGVPTDGITGLQVRRSMQLRRSDVGGTRSSIGARLLGRDDEESAVGLTDLAEDSDSYSEDDDGMGRLESTRR